MDDRLVWSMHSLHLKIDMMNIELNQRWKNLVNLQSKRQSLKLWKVLLIWILWTVRMKKELRSCALNQLLMRTTMKISLISKISKNQRTRVTNPHIETEHFSNMNTNMMSTINSFKKENTCMTSMGMKVSNTILRENKINTKMMNSFETCRFGTLRMRFLRVNRVRLFKSNLIRRINRMVDLKLWMSLFKVNLKVHDLKNKSLKVHMKILNILKERKLMRPLIKRYNINSKFWKTLRIFEKKQSSLHQEMKWSKVWINLENPLNLPKILNNKSPPQTNLLRNPRIKPHCNRNQTQIPKRRHHEKMKAMTTILNKNKTLEFKKFPEVNMMRYSMRLKSLIKTNKTTSIISLIEFHQPRTNTRLNERWKQWIQKIITQSNLKSNLLKRRSKKSINLQMRLNLTLKLSLNHSLIRIIPRHHFKSQWFKNLLKSNQRMSKSKLWKNYQNLNLKSQSNKSKRKLLFQNSNQLSLNDNLPQRKIHKSLDRNLRNQVQNEFLKNLNPPNLDKWKRLLNKRSLLIISNRRRKNDLLQETQSSQVQAEVQSINLKKIEKKLKLQ